MAGIDILNVYPNSKMARAAKLGQSRFRSVETAAGVAFLGGFSGSMATIATTNSGWTAFPTLPPTPPGFVSAIIQADGDDIAFSLNQTVPSGATPASGFGFIRNGDSITVSPSDVAHISFRNKNNAAASVHIYYR